MLIEHRPSHLNKDLVLFFQPHRSIEAHKVKKTDALDHVQHKKPEIEHF